MQDFSYKAVTKTGKKIEGVKKALNNEAVAKWLHEQDLIVISISENLGLKLKSVLNLQIGGVPLKDRVVFARQLSTMLSASLPILQALEILVQQTKNESLKVKLQSVYNAVESGTSLSEAFSKEKSMFSELQISLLKAGEKSGNLNTIMDRIATDMEKSKKLRSKITGALIYPAVIFFVMFIVFIVLIVFMVPGVKSLYEGLGIKELPAVTNVLISLSDILSNPLGLLSFVIIILAIGLGFRYYYSTFLGRRQIDRLILRIPVFGDLNTKIQLAQFTRLLSMLLQSGVPIIETLTTIATAMSNSLYRDLVNYTAQEVAKGSALTVPMSKGGIVPVTLLKILATGELTGKLDKVSGDMGVYYEQEVDEVANNLTKLIEPLILLVVGGMVALIAVAIYLPIYSLGQYL